MPLSGSKCRVCQQGIYTDRGEQLTVYDGHSYHRGCFDAWVLNRVKRLEGKLRKSGLTELEREDLKEFRELARLSR